MRANRMSAAITVALSIAGGTATAGTNLAITAFAAGYLTWTNVNPSLYYTVQWRSALTATNDWTGSYSGCQDVNSTGDTITVPVPVFYRVTGSSSRSFFAAPVARTGQTPSEPYLAAGGSDGALQKGKTLPNPRFTVGTGAASNCVMDNLTGLMWLRNPDVSTRTWYQALTYCDQLDGSSGRGDFDDWRMPNIKELTSLTDWRFQNPALPDTTGSGQCSLSGDPFYNVLANWYWSSTTVAANNDYAWRIYPHNGYTDNFILKTGSIYVWPVRGGD